MEVVPVVMSPSRLRLVKRFLWNYAPPLFRLARFVRTGLHRRHERRLRGHLAAVQQAVIARHGLVVQAGPFRGMRYLGRSHGSALLPKLVGSYEADLHPVLRRAIARGPARVIDVGCAEGYYAVGLALRLPGATYAFDIAAGARLACRELAALNGVADRVVIDGECTAARLNELAGPGALVVCDIEGAEVELLDPARAPRLRQADLLIEAHDDLRLDVEVTPTLLARFRDSHDVTRVRLRQRDPAAFAALAFLAPGSQRLALHEDRLPGQEWLFLTPKVRKGGSGATDLDEDGAFAVAQGNAGEDAAEGAVRAQRAVAAVEAEGGRRV
jgi:hypothetical protein